MRFKTLTLSLLCAGAAWAAAPVNLTPAPKQMQIAEGVYALPQGLKVGIGGLQNDMADEAVKFVSALNTATGLGAVTVTDGAADITISTNASVAPEGYNLTVGATGVSVEASTPTGLYYAFQTIKKVLPPNVMAGKAATGTYELPQFTVNDAPRFEYRGFMLDVCRHFFTVEEVKRMIDVMSYYKMNVFHWHLTEDQGWRMEVPSWPKLTTVGATASNVSLNDWHNKTEYWANKVYGPHFYTIDEMKDVVAYAAERHITVVPEVEFPGHASAVCTAYPELSCWPDGEHSVKTSGGVYSDVLNIANPQTLQFAKDVIDVLCEVFPSEIYQLGGDECPTNAWINNKECQDKVKELGFKGDNDDQKYRKLQNWFTLQLAEYAKTKGKRIGCWNESITAAGADLATMKKTDATIWCWTGPDNAVNVGVNNGLRVVYTPYSSGDGKQYDGTPSTGTKGSFYINRKQDPDDAPANGNTWDTVDKVYNTTPFTTEALNTHRDLCYGVQGTFWTERVDDHEYLEWLALPRLIAIAEVGWTPQSKKNFSDFISRVKADLPMLDLNGYNYSPYFLEDAINNYTMVCTDAAGNELQRKPLSLSTSSTDFAAYAPQIRNYTLRSTTLDGTTVNCVYERTGATVISRGVTEQGVLVDVIERDYPLGQVVDFSSLVPDGGEYFTFVKTVTPGSQLTVSDNATIEHLFSSEARMGVRKAGEPVGEIQPGKLYLIHDANADNGRDCYRYATTATSSKVAGNKFVNDRDPYFVWTLEALNNNFAIKNLGNDKYVQAVVNNTQGSLGKNAREYVITKRDDGFFTIKNAANDQAWDGQGNLNMVGWNAPGHPMEFVEFYGRPMFLVTVTCVDTEGKTLGKATSEFVDAGSEYVLTVPDKTGKTVVKIEGNEGLGAVKADANVVITYGDENAINDIHAPATKANAIYDLQGRRVTRLSRGIYIVNGVKTLIR